MNEEFEKLKTLVRSIGHATNGEYRLSKSKEALEIVHSIERRLCAPCLSPLEQRASDFNNDFKNGD